MIIDIIVLLLKCAQLTRPAGGREGGGQSRRVMKVTTTDQM